MIDATLEEIQLLLWNMHAIDLAYGNQAPLGTAGESIRHKLTDEAQRLRGSSHAQQDMLVRTHPAVS